MGGFFWSRFRKLKELTMLVKDLGRGFASMDILPWRQSEIRNHLRDVVSCGHFPILGINRVKQVSVLKKIPHLDD